MKKRRIKEFIGDNLVYRSIALYLLLNCLIELLTGYFFGWEVLSYVI